MSCKIKCVQLNLEDSIYNHINEYIESYIPDTDISYFLKCCLINHLINLNVLNECGLPNPFCIPPKLDFSTIDTEGIFLSALRDISSGNADK